ncbi:MAG: sensor histidine kinase [Chitinophagaceae bacterium]|nr:MAG: sensor histidine kinase [Chitinophagaceae bacterium]
MDPQETRLYYAILIACGIVGLIIVFFIISIIRQQRRNLVLHRQNMLAEISTLEKERARMARDLHDELAPVLAAVKMRINSFVLTDADDQEELARTSAHIDSLMKRIREITFDLMPSSLERNGFAAAAREFLEYVRRSGRLDIRFESSSTVRVEEQKAVNLYRILQEVVQNTLKHADARRLVVSLTQEKKDLVLATTDDGKGFDYEKLLDQKGGIGLRSLRSRVEIMNGAFFCESRKGKGTSYIFRIPIQ